MYLYFSRHCRDYELGAPLIDLHIFPGITFFQRGFVYPELGIGQLDEQKVKNYLFL